MKFTKMTNAAHLHDTYQKRLGHLGPGAAPFPSLSTPGPSPRYPKRSVIKVDTVLDHFSREGMTPDRGWFDSNPLGFSLPASHNKEKETDGAAIGSTCVKFNRGVGILFLLALLLPGVASASSRAEELTLIAVAAADVVTTEWGLTRGLAEANPVGQHRGARIAIKTASTAGIILLARKAERGGRPKLARWLRGIGIAASAGAAGWNLSVTLSNNRRR